MAMARERVAQELVGMFIPMMEVCAIAGVIWNTTAAREWEMGGILVFVVVAVFIFMTTFLFRGGITTKAKEWARWELWGLTHLIGPVATMAILAATSERWRRTPIGHILTRVYVDSIWGSTVLLMPLYCLNVVVGMMRRIFSGAIIAWARRRELHTWIIGSVIPQVLREWGTAFSSEATMELIFIPQVLPLACAGILGAILAGGTVVHLCIKWSIHILIVLSLLSQVFLFISAGIRWRSASAVHRICLWLAYLLADNVALYTLGHMTLNSMLHVDPLVIFWVPFFLLHLGGQDTITTYSLENQLWLRRLPTLVQVIGAAHILHFYIARTRILVLPTVLMFMVGLVKYVERVWALKCTNIENLGTSLDIALIADEERAYCRLDRREDLDVEEEVLLGAHYLFSYCKSELVNRQATIAAFTAATAIKQGSRFNGRMYMYELVEMELSLMYDFLYTKVPVIYTWHGCFIRVVSLLSMVASFLLFQIGRHGADSVNVFISSFLLVGAVFLEMTSLLRALCSSWTCALLHARNWDQIHAMVVRLRRLVKAASNRRWLHSIGQHNLLDFCSRDKTLPSIRIAIVVGLEDWWNKVLYSSTITIPPGVKEAVMEKIVQTMRQCRCTGLDIRHVRGRAVLTNSRIFDDIDRIFKDKCFDECILIWHIATEIYLCSCNRQNEEEPFVEAMELLSNYMGFLLMVRPELLPCGVSRSLYPDICSDLEKEWHELSTEKVEHGSRDSIGEDKDISTRQEEDTRKQSTGQVEDRCRQSTGEMEDETRISIKEEEGASKQSMGRVKVAINTSNGEIEHENEIREVEDGNKIKEVEHENEISEVEDGNEIREVEHENQIREVKRENQIREEDTRKQSTGQVEDRCRQSTGEMEDETRISIKEEEGASKQSMGHVEVAINTSNGEIEHENEIREVEDGNKIKEVEHENEISEVEDGNEIREVEHENQIREVKRENQIREEDTRKQSTGQVEDRCRQSTGEMEDETRISIKEEEGASKQSMGQVEVAINTSNGEIEHENEIREVEDGNKIKEVEHENEISEVEDGNEIKEVEHENQIREVKRENQIREGDIISTEKEKNGNHSSFKKDGNHKHSKLTERQKLANHLLYKYNNSRYPTAYHKGSHLASKLLRNEWNIPNMPELIFAVWVEYLCYAAYHVTGVSHCRQLASGGDFLTVIRLVIAHIELFELDRQDSEDLRSVCTDGSINTFEVLEELFKQFCADGS